MRGAAVLLVSVMVAVALSAFAATALAAGGCAPGNPSATGAHADVFTDTSDRWFDATSATPQSVTVATVGSVLGGTSVLFRLFAWDGATGCAPTSHGATAAAFAESFDLDAGRWLIRFAPVDGGDNGAFTLVVGPAAST